jgi:hypothetical protein
MAELTQGQERMRGRMEGLIALAAPALDLVLAVGERISRIAEPEDHEYYPVRPGRKDESLLAGAGEPRAAQEDPAADPEERSPESAPGDPGA